MHSARWVVWGVIYRDLRRWRLDRDGESVLGVVGLVGEGAQVRQRVVVMAYAILLYIHHPLPLCFASWWCDGVVWCGVVGAVVGAVGWVGGDGNG